MRSRHVDVRIDLDRVRAAAERIRAAIGVALIAVIKADAYGLGAARVADALAAVADDFAYFSIHEAREVGRGGLVLGPPEGDPAQYRELKLRPSISRPEEAERFAGLGWALNLDTGMQRFGCAAEEFDELLSRGGATEAWTHADSPRAAEVLRELGAGRVGLLHAASSSLLDCPAAHLDAVRPGLALYRGAVRVATRLIAVRQARGRIGYSGFEAGRVGIVGVGYSHHLLAAPVVVNGRRQRLLEVGMNTSFVSVAPGDRPGDEVLLLGEGLSEAELARHLRIREHEVLCRYTSLGVRSYGPPAPVTGAGDTRRSSVASRRQT